MAAEATLKNAGLDPKLVADVLKNPKVTAQVVRVFGLAGINESNRCPAAVGKILYALATNLPALPTPFVEANLPAALKFVMDGRIRTALQVDEAVKYLKDSSEWSEEAFGRAVGAGVVVTPAEIQQVLDNVLAANREALLTERYHLANKMLAVVKADPAVKWADSKELKTMYDAAILALLGEKTAADNEKKPKKKEVKEAASPAAATASAAAAASEEPISLAEEADDFLHGREIPEAVNTPEQLAKHLANTGGKMRTRFPPEPNGYLHIGHAKAMAFNFGQAVKHGGECYLRFDDTNPEAEKGEYIDNIIENVNWLGHKPTTVTYSSDYFGELYELAVKLIKKGKAYACHQTAAEIKESRVTKIGSPWRERSVEESLKIFEDMRKGKYAEGAATIRMKGDMNHPNPQMWDIVAYRIKYAPHPHVGNKWCIYPSYDYTHCIIDSLENITHSLCTLEFEVRRESYFWLLWELDLYKPKVWEYSRLNITYNVMSKRKLKQLVEDNIVRGWDDPRMMTLNGLRRRGVSPEAINEFCKLVGVSRNANTVRIALLEHCIREDLNLNAPRAMVVVNPLKVTLINYPEDKVEDLVATNFPFAERAAETRTMPFSRVFYIERDDFRLDGAKDKNFFGLAPGKVAHLKNAYNIECKEAITAADGSVVELRCTVDLSNAVKPKGKLHWVAEPRPGVAPATAELRLYEHLFKSEDPGSMADWLNDLNPNSLRVVQNAMVEPSLVNATKFSRFQFERVAYFACDPDSTPEKLVFNRTVTLKESKDKA